MVALPAVSASTRPFELTVATEVLLELHVTALFTASFGVTVATNVELLPAVRLSEFVFKLTPVTLAGSYGESV